MRGEGGTEGGWGGSRKGGVTLAKTIESMMAKKVRFRSCYMRVCVCACVHACVCVCVNVIGKCVCVCVCVFFF